MAKAKSLAALAGLAGLAYAMRNKDKGESTTDTGDETDRLKGRGKSSEESAGDKAVSDTKSSVLTALQKPKNIREEGIAEANDVRTATSAPKSAAKPASAKQAPSVSDRRTIESGMSRGTRGADASKAYPSGVMGGARQADTGSKVADTVKTVAKTAAQGPAGAIATAAKPVADKATNAMRETYRDLSGKVRYKEPSGPSAAQTIGDAVASGAKKVGSGISDYVKNFETPAERRSREAKNPSPKAAPTEYDEDALSKGSAMRRGGAVKKMASGGMTASRRADGIATRGKTRCKMY
jgi:hypothetical protein